MSTKTEAVELAENIETLPTVEQALIEIKKPLTDKLQMAVDKALKSELKDVQSVTGYNNADKTVKSISKIIAAIEKKRKELVDPAVKYQRSINAEVKPIKERLESARDHLKANLKLIDDEKARLEQQLRQKRIQSLSSIGFTFDGYHYTAGETVISAENITQLTEDEFKAAYDIGAAFIKEQQAKEKAEREAREAEQAKIKAEREELERQKAEIEKERAELAQLRAEKAQREKQAKATPPAEEPIFKQAMATPPPSVVEQQVPDLAPMYEPEEPVIDQEEFNSIQEQAPDLFAEGFQHCKLLILKEFNSGIKKNRSEWVQWISALQPKP